LHIHSQKADEIFETATVVFWFYLSTRSYLAACVHALLAAGAVLSLTAILFTEIHLFVVVQAAFRRTFAWYVCV
jgi:hypothetical protein